MLEVASYRALAESAVGRHVSVVHVDDPHCLAPGLSKSRLASALHGVRLTAARRTGKVLLLDTTGPTVGIRFGMTGELLVDDRWAIDKLLFSARQRAARFVRLRVAFKEGGTVGLSDPRRFARVTLNPDELAMGPDAQQATLGQLRTALRTRSPGVPALKARLLDQSRLAGLGNLLVDEALWRAGLRPDRPAGSLDDTELRRLHRVIRSTLTELDARGGSHMGDLMAARAVGGRCPADGAVLTRATIGGRTTWWCPRHQT